MKMEITAVLWARKHRKIRC